MTTSAQRLRQKLLDLAIRGKLVPQNPKDEPAEKLLARIRRGEFQTGLTGFTGLRDDGRVEVEKCRGRARRPATAAPKNPVNHVNPVKKYPPISDDEKPFAIPQGWAWCRLGEITESFSAKPYQILESKIAKVGTFPVVSQGQKFIDGYCNDETKVCRCVVGADPRAARNHDATADHNCGAAGVRALPVITLAM